MFFNRKIDKEIKISFHNEVLHSCYKSDSMKCAGKGMGIKSHSEKGNTETNRKINSKFSIMCVYQLLNK